tara:strand:- start:175 stop:558 length:384 start_codon:yes stop_codon:yes gene_type:complete
VKIGDGDCCLLQVEIVMACFKYQSQVEGNCLLSSFAEVLENAGFYISKDFSNPAQIFAECKNVDASYQSKVNVLISWSDKTKKECSVEVRSDEPFLKRNTRCEMVNGQLRKLIPPTELSDLFTSAEV